MVHRPDITQLKETLVASFHEGDEARAQTLVFQLGTQPRQRRAVLEEMLESQDARVRQAAAFGLGELGGAADAKRLAQQLAHEEARGDHDGESVVEVITQALGRIEDASARMSLLRRLRRLAAAPTTEPSDVNVVARALWRRRHPELVPHLQSALEQLAPRASRFLDGLLVLLEKSPGELGAWAQDASVPVSRKTDVLTVLEEDVPDAWVSILPSFISGAQAVVEQAVNKCDDASEYCDSLFSLLLLHRERLLAAFPSEARADLLSLARRLVAAVDTSCALRAAVVLKHVGHPEDALLLQTHRPASPVLAKVFDEAAQALRNHPTA